MLLYNVTVAVEPEVQEEWLQWMESVHLPEVMSTGKFERCRMFYIHPMEPEQVPSYSIQYEAETMENYEDYIRNFGPELRQKTVEKYGEKVLAFRTLLEHRLTLQKMK